MDKRPIYHMLLTVLAFGIILTVLLMDSFANISSMVSIEIRRMTITMVGCFIYVGLLTVVYKK